MSATPSRLRPAPHRSLRVAGPRLLAVRRPAPGWTRLLFRGPRRAAHGLLSDRVRCRDPATACGIPAGPPTRHWAMATRPLSFTRPWPTMSPKGSTCWARQRSSPSSGPGRSPQSARGWRCTPTRAASWAASGACSPRSFMSTYPTTWPTSTSGRPWPSTAPLCGCPWPCWPSTGWSKR